MASSPESTRDAITIAIENNSCGRCRVAGLPICKCGGRGSGSSGASSGEGSDETKNKDVPYASNMVPTSGQLASTAIQEFDKAKTMWVQFQLSSDRVINYEAGLLSIESNKLLGNLILRPQSGLSKYEKEISQQFFKAVQIEFEEFKKQLAEQGVSTKNFTAVIKDNELAIQIPIPKFYYAFIKHLESKNLLPIPNPERQEKKDIIRPTKEDKTQAFNPNPFSTRLERKK